jgi:hypothetical protein
MCCWFIVAESKAKMLRQFFGPLVKLVGQGMQFSERELIARLGGIK